ncbi:hypothetical protein [Oceanobacillus damuensis]|uniref:hypothetical protein n=1 Tax=Oceanobacillus damuensis TaxID=937928 RepID=UPI00082B990F|nr:hypothetical protein [Oceanobacillus damuensis]
MRHPYRKLIQMEFISLLFALLIGFSALITGYIIILFLSIYLIVLSLVCDAMILLYTRHPVEAGKQAVRGIMLFLFTTYFIFQL